jgi:hypothetical protein
MVRPLTMSLRRDESDAECEGPTDVLYMALMVDLEEHSSDNVVGPLQNG